jgi:hypothetical protein
MNPSISVQQSVDTMETIITMRFADNPNLLDHMSREMPRILVERAADAYFKEHHDELMAKINVDELTKSAMGQIAAAIVDDAVNRLMEARYPAQELKMDMPDPLNLPCPGCAHPSVAHTDDGCHVYGCACKRTQE